MGICPQCGIEVCLNVVEKRKYRDANDPLLNHCKDCRATPAKSITYSHPILGLIQCYPWAGELSDDWYPVDDVGDLVKPGERICGHKDCMNRNHIEPFKRIVDDVEKMVEEWKENAPLPKERNRGATS